MNNSMQTNITIHDNGILTYTIQNVLASPYYLYITRGWGNGYIALPLDHKWAGIDYCSSELPNIHGGWTFGENEIVLGSEYYVLGFDTSHSGDNIDIWSEAAVNKHIKSVVLHFK